jgi:Mn2+/Fe2+ NRAMP family transporter
MLAANKREIMGSRTNGRAMNILGWTTAIIMSAAAAIGLVASWGG